MSTVYMPLIDFGPDPRSPDHDGAEYGDPVYSEARVVKQLARGNLTADGWRLLAIHSFDVVDGWAKDCTDEIARKAFDFLCDEQDRYGREAVDRKVKAFIADRLGIEYLNALS